MAKSYFDPKPTKYPFPEQTDEHYLKAKKDNGAVFDASYPYVDRSKSFRRMQKVARVALWTIVFPMVRIKLGLKIRGRENLKIHKNELTSGAVLVSNHVHMWDYLAILCALRRSKIGVLVWKKNVSGESGTLVRWVGGIPIPEGDAKAALAFRQHVNAFLAEGGWLQTYAEGSMWEYYAPIRPFKTGAAVLAIDSNIPVLPMAFSYRKPGFFRKLFGQQAKFTLSIGEPIYADPTLTGTEAQDDLTKRLHDEVCRLAGIVPDQNVYGPVFHEDKRVDYY